jgi:hypothetical protein
MLVLSFAADAFKFVIDDVYFSAEDFEPFVKDLLFSLFELLSPVHLTETKKSLMNLLEKLIPQMGSKISPYAPQVSRSILGRVITWFTCDHQIADLICKCWPKTSKDQSVLQQAIVRVLNLLVLTSPETSQQFHALLIPLIAFATDPSREEFVYLVDEALELWQSLMKVYVTYYDFIATAHTHTLSLSVRFHLPLKCAHEVGGEVLSLWPRLPPLLVEFPEHVRVGLRILESYLFAFPMQFLSTYGHQVCPSIL